MKARSAGLSAALVRQHLAQFPNGARAKQLLAAINDHLSSSGLTHSTTLGVMRPLLSQMAANGEIVISFDHGYIQVYKLKEATT